MQQDLERFGEIGRTLKEKILPQLQQNYKVAKELTDTLNVERTLNIEFLAGKQWVAWDSKNAILRTVHPMLSGGVVEPVIDNVLEPLAAQRVSFMAASTPIFESVSVTSQGQDMIDAAMADRMFGVFWDKYNLGTFFSRGHYVDMPRYNCFYRSYWDYGAGAVRQVGILGPDGQEVRNYRATGDIQIERVNPQCVYVDPLAERVMPVRTEATDARWLFFMRNMDIGWVMKQPWARGTVETVVRGDETREILWGGLPTEDEIPAAESMAATEGDAQAYAAIGVDVRRGAEGASTHPHPDKTGAHGKLVEVGFYYEHKSEDYPHGQFMAFLPQQDNWWVCEYRPELPEATETEPDGLFLWCMSKDKQCTGRLAGESRITQCRALQVELNWAWTTWRTLRKNVKPILIYDMDATINIDPLLNSGYFLAVGYHSNQGYSGVVKPEVFWPPALQLEANTAQAEAQFITRKIEDKIGIHNPANIPHKHGTTWSEISVILSRDLDQIRDNDVARHEQEVYAPFLWGMVKLAQRHMPEDTLLTFFGDRGKPEVIRFKKAALNASDIRIVPGTTMRQSKAVIRELYMKAMELRLLDDPDPLLQRQNYRNAIASMNLQVGIEAGLETRAMARAQAENLLLLEGRVVPVAWHEPPDVHIREHWNCLNSADFYNVPDAQKPNVLAQFYAHMDCHAKVATLSQNNISNAVMLGTQQPNPQDIQPPQPGAGQPPPGEAAQPSASLSAAAGIEGPEEFGPGGDIVPGQSLPTAPPFNPLNPNGRPR